MTNTKETQSIISGPKGRRLIVQDVLNQIPVVTMMRVGFIHGSILFDRDYIKFKVSCAPRRQHWVIVKLDLNDTYSVEFGRLKNKFDWHVAAQLSGVYGDVLGETIERLYQEVYS